jgi:hypothetical protein
MHLRQSMMLSLPLLLCSSLAFAQQGPDAKKKKTEKAAEPQERSTTILGETVTNKDKDLDVSVGKTRTTSAEPRDVVESRAEETREIEGRRWSVAPLLGYGTNDFKLGIGARAGYTFKTPVYVGGTFLYHFGADNILVGPGITEASSRLYYPAAEVGYDIGIGPVLVRPYGGAGFLFTRTSITTNGVSASDTKSSLMIYPGATAQFIFPRSPVFVGGDMRLLLPIENEGASFSLFATAGVTM